jgi:hypothetical protein
MLTHHPCHPCRLQAGGFPESGCAAIQNSASSAYVRMGGFGPALVMPEPGLSIGLWQVAELRGNLVVKMDFYLGTQMCSTSRRPLATAGFAVYGE